LPDEPRVQFPRSGGLQFPGAPPVVTPRPFVKRREDREKSRAVLLNRCRYIAQQLAGIPTGREIYTDEQHREHVFGRDTREAPPAPPSPSPERREAMEWNLSARADERLLFGPRRARVPVPAPTAEERAAFAAWRLEQPTTPRSSKVYWSLPPSFGIDPGDRGGHQQLADQADKAIRALESCGHWRQVYACPEHGAWAATSRCGHRLCTPCAVVRRSEMLDRYGPHLTNISDDQAEPRVPMLTLTQVGEDGEWLSEAFDRLQARHRAFTRAVRIELHGVREIHEHPECFDHRGKGGRARGRARRELMKKGRENRGGVGGLTSLEATPRPGKRWNAHAHVLLREPEWVPDGWTVPHRTKARPLDPWRFRFLWATALIDGRTRRGRGMLAMLRAAYKLGRAAWLRKQRARQRLAEAKAKERRALKTWARSCKAAGVPSVVDLRFVHPAEGVKYITKGYELDPKRGAPVTDWHLWQLLVGTYYLRRTVPWGTLYRLPKPEEQDPPDEQPEHRPCPHCGAKSAPIPREEWRGSGAAPDTLLMALRLDRRPYRPRGPPSGAAARAAREAAPPWTQEPGADRALAEALGW